MRPSAKHITSVITVSVVSYILQVAWVIFVEPTMESNGVMFRGILPTGDIISGVAIILINNSGAVALGALFKGGIPIWLCLFYNVLYTLFLLVYSPGRLAFHLSEDFFTSIPFAAFLLEIIPFFIARLLIKHKK